MNSIEIAKVCHAVNRAYCAALGDDSVPTWGDAPEWHRESMIAAVNATLSGKAVSPEEQHGNWMAHKAKEGWKFGEKFDAEAKTHPSMIPYLDLPRRERAKDKIFRTVAEALYAPEVKLPPG